MIAALLVSSLALAPQPVDTARIVTSAIRDGRVGERYDGYLDFVVEPDETMRRAVGEINIRRRALYGELGAQSRVAPREVGVATACKLLPRLPMGGRYQLSDGAWRTIASDTPLTLPAYCPKSVR